MDGSSVQKINNCEVTLRFKNPLLPAQQPKNPSKLLPTGEGKHFYSSLVSFLITYEPVLIFSRNMKLKDL